MQQFQVFLVQFKVLAKSGRKALPIKQVEQHGFRHLKDGTLNKASSVFGRARESGVASKRDVQELRNIAKQQATLYGDKGKMAYVSSTGQGNSTTLVYTPRPKAAPKLNPGPTPPKKRGGGLGNTGHSTSPVRGESEHILNQVSPRSYILGRSKIRANGKLENMKVDNLSMFTPGEMSGKL